MRPTRWPSLASAMARLTLTVLLPTPPLPELTARMRPRLGRATGCGAGVRAAGAGVGSGAIGSGRPGRAAGRAGVGACWRGSRTFTFTSVTPETVETASRMSRTRAASSRLSSRTVSWTFPSTVTAMSWTISAVMTSVSRRAFRTRARAVVICCVSDTIASPRAGAGRCGARSGRGRTGAGYRQSSPAGQCCSFATASSWGWKWRATAGGNPL